MPERQPPSSFARRLAGAVTGPRGRWVTIAVWALLGVTGFVGREEIGGVTAAGQTSFLPADAESTRSVEALQRLGGGEEVPAVIVFERRGGLRPADLNAIGRIGVGIDRLGLTGATPVIDPFSAEARRPLGDVARIANGIGPISRDGEAALVVLAIDAGDRGAVVRELTRSAATSASTPVRDCAPTSPDRPGSPPTSSRSPTTPGRRCWSPPSAWS